MVVREGITCPSILFSGTRPSSRSISTTIHSFISFPFPHPSLRSILYPMLDRKVGMDEWKEMAFPYLFPSLALTSPFPAVKSQRRVKMRKWDERERVRERVREAHPLHSFAISFLFPHRFPLSSFHSSLVAPPASFLSLSLIPFTHIMSLLHAVHPARSCVLALRHGSRLFSKIMGAVR